MSNSLTGAASPAPGMQTSKSNLRLHLDASGSIRQQA